MNEGIRKAARKALEEQERKVFQFQGQTYTAIMTDDSEDMTLELLEQMKDEMAKLPPILCGIWCSIDDSCELVQALESLPPRNPSSSGLTKTLTLGAFTDHIAGIPVNREEFVVKNRAVLEFTDGSCKLLIKNELGGVWILISENSGAIEMYSGFIKQAKGERIWKS